MAKKKHHITPEDLYDLTFISGAGISPDGKSVVYAQKRVDRKSEKKYSSLWIVSAQGGEPRQFTYGDHSDSSPKWSPDDDQIAFLSNRGNPEKPPQIYLIARDFGEARPLTDIKGVITGFEWSPDGKKLLLSVIKTDADVLEREKDEAKKKLGIVARHFERVQFKYDGFGFLPKEGLHIWTVRVSDGKAKQLTDHALYTEDSATWSPDSQTIAFLSNRTDDPDFNIGQDKLYTIPAKGGEMTELDLFIGSKYALSYSPDGKWIAFYGHEGAADWYKNNHIWIIPADGSAPPKDLMSAYDIHTPGGTLNDTSGVENMPPTWAPDSQRIYFQADIKGVTPLMSVNINGGDLQTHLGDESSISTFTFDQSGKYLAYYEATMTDPGQLKLLDLESGTINVLSSFNKDFFKKKRLGNVEEVWITGPDNNELHGFILTPPEFDPGKKYPSILEIHGGPMAQYGFHFMHEFYVLAAKGYVVHYCNPRGGRGYGEEHTKTIWNDWGNRDYADIMAWVDHISSLPYIDSKRMGVTGGSYGGYMTNWIIGHTDRFKAAATQRSICNIASFYGATDGNWVWENVFGGKPPWEDLDNYWRMSPLKYIANAKTPTLIIHSEEDLRCPIDQAEQLFVALKRLNVETKLVRFPGESHGLSRGGRTDRRIERLNAIAGWFDKHL